jgi:hypothetical protein
MASSKLLTTAMSASFRRFSRLASSPLLPPASRRPPGPFLSARFCSAAAATTKTAPGALDVAYPAAAAATTIAPEALDVAAATTTGPEALDVAATTKTAPEALDVAYSAVAAVSAGHPWPEWGDFLEKLRAKGYFERPPPPGSDAAKSAAGDGEVAADPYVLRDQNRVKNACLKFARERFDLLRLGTVRWILLLFMNWTLLCC